MTRPLSSPSRSTNAAPWYAKLFASRVAPDAQIKTRFSAPDLTDIGYDPRPVRAQARWNAPKTWSV